MISVNDRERIRRAHFDEKWSRRRIDEVDGHDRRTINKALANAEAATYGGKVPRHAPMLGAWHERLDALIAESDKLPGKQRLTAQRIYDIVQGEGFAGSIPSIERYVYGLLAAAEDTQRYFCRWTGILAMTPSADWGEAQVDLAGERMVVQFLLLRTFHASHLCAPTKFK